MNDKQINERKGNNDISADDVVCTACMHVCVCICVCICMSF